VQLFPQMHQKLFGGRAPDPLGEVTTLTHMWMDIRGRAPGKGTVMGR